jgi:hypothetical protein
VRSAGPPPALVAGGPSGERHAEALPENEDQDSFANTRPEDLEVEIARDGVPKTDVREDGGRTSPACLLELSPEESPTYAATSELPLDDLSIGIDLPRARLDPDVVAREPVGSAGDPRAPDEPAFVLRDQAYVSVRQSQPYAFGINEPCEGGGILRNGEPNLDSGPLEKRRLLRRPLDEEEPLKRDHRTPNALNSPEGEDQGACGTFPFAAGAQAVERVVHS